MTWTQPGKTNPEALIDAAGNALVSPAVTVSPSGYTVSFVDNNDLVITGPPKSGVSYTVTVGGVAQQTITGVTVMPTPEEIDSRIVSALTTAATETGTVSGRVDALTTRVDALVVNPGKVSKVAQIGPDAQGNVALTPVDIGAAQSMHTHADLASSVDTLTDQVTNLPAPDPTSAAWTLRQMGVYVVTGHTTADLAAGLATVPAWAQLAAVRKA